MSAKTENYLVGMRAIEHFDRMLQAAMLDVLKGAELFASGAFVWRGYQILQYNDFAPGQYFCQVYPGTAESHGFLASTLIFQEAYKDEKHNPIDDKEEMLKIKQESYYYPFYLPLDLYRSRFFLMEFDEQFRMIKAFLTYALGMAEIWQHSETRKRVTNARFLSPKKAHRNSKLPAGELARVDLEYMDAWKLQNLLWDVLKPILDQDAPVILNRNLIRCKANESIYHHHYRGYHQKFDGLTTSNESDFRWVIRYDHPEALQCIKGKDTVICCYNLIEQRFFDLNQAQQTVELRGFVEAGLRKRNSH